ncbi:hypothetical protein KI387_010365, partial [Taxus chinensis]
LPVNIGIEEVDEYLPATERKHDEPPQDEVVEDFPKLCDKKVGERKLKIKDW